MHNFPHHNMSSTSYQQTYTRSHPSLHSLRRKSLNSSFPVILLVLYPIPSHLLQAISPAVVPALTHIVNTSLHTGVLPSAFRQARITPLFKKPTLNPTLLGNYKPVCLLPFIAVFNQVSAFLTQNNLLNSNQSGFRSGYSTKTALLSVIDGLRLARVDFKSSILILLDLSAVFDTVNHQYILSTLLAKGISGTALQRFESYLSDGVPPGSVLGPLLLSVYMASLGSVIISLFIIIRKCFHQTVVLGQNSHMGI